MTLQRKVCPISRLRSELPIPKLAPFERAASSAAANLTVLLTNMLRTEIAAVFREVRLLAERAHLLTVAEYPNLYPWLRDCELCVWVVLEELQHILNVVETKAANMDTFPQREHQLCIEDIRISVLNVARTQAPCFQYDEALHRFQNLCFKARDLNKGLEYMNLIDSELPRIISEAFTDREVRAMQRAVMKSFLSKMGEFRDVRAIVRGWKASNQTWHLILLRPVLYRKSRRCMFAVPRWRTLALMWKFMWEVVGGAICNDRTRGAPLGKNVGVQKPVRQGFVARRILPPQGAI